jgi:hypothetical protein
MAVIAVARYELYQANLTWLLDSTRQDINYLSEMYYWPVEHHAAMVCMLAGIGKILGGKPIDTRPEPAYTSNT